MEVEEVVIIGAGPAGLAAGLQLQRYGMAPKILECARPGGLLLNANWVENYPGFPRGMSGLELVKLMLQQTQELGIEIIAARVNRLDWNGRHLRAETDRGVYRARCVVIATGTRPCTFTDFALPLQNSDRIMYEVASLLDLEGAQIAIVGAGDAAFDYALNLARRGNQIWLLNRGDTLKCLPLLWERSRLQSLIRYLHHTAIHEVRTLPNGQLKLECSSPAGASSLQVDYLIGALGREPQTAFITVNLQKHIPTLEGQGWLYFCGDVVNGLNRQTAIAVGDGLRAAMQIYRKLKETTL